MIPVSGVDFKTLGKLFGNAKVQLPVAIVTDADPPVDHEPKTDESWRSAFPRCPPECRAS